MNLVTFNPEETLDRFFDTNRFFDFPQASMFRDTEATHPKVNVIEKDGAYHLEAETPGLTDKDVSVEFHAGVLTLKGHREKDKETKKDEYSIREFSKQSFERSFRLSNHIDSEKVTARMDQGILKVTLPKKEQVKPKKIEIKLEPSS